MNPLYLFLRRMLSSWRALLLGAVALVGYLVLPVLLRWYDPTAGLFDAGYLQWAALATFLACWAGFVGWVIFQCVFATIDQASANNRGEWGNLEEWFQSIPPRWKWAATQVAFVLCVSLYLVCLKLIALQ